jgi:hypothetical protein
MKYLNFYKTNKKTKDEIVKFDKPSQEQLLFADKVLEIINPVAENFGFNRYKIEIERFFTQITFRKNNLYIKVVSSIHPRDYPNFYNIILGEGNSDDFYEYDWNSIALWRLKIMINPDTTAKEYAFPFGDKIKYSVNNANEELLKYGISFLTGDLNLFYKTRAEQNKNREPYKIHAPDKNGNYQAIDEPKSAEQKKKYS